RSLGLTVPGDLSVVGYDDVFWAALTNPPLTTVRQAVGSIARAAVRTALSGGGEGSRRPARTEVVVRPQLVVRGSTAAAPVGGEDGALARVGPDRPLRWLPWVGDRTDHLPHQVRHRPYPQSGPREEDRRGSRGAAHAHRRPAHRGPAHRPLLRLAAQPGAPAGRRCGDLAAGRRLPGDHRP